jgi:hypothetical protein
MSLIAAMVAKHRWGTPMDEDHLLAVSAVSKHEYPDARRAFETLRYERFITNRGSQGIELDNGRFDELAEFLFHECAWQPFEIELRLKHYGGWDQHAWY